METTVAPFYGSNFMAILVRCWNILFSCLYPSDTILIQLLRLQLFEFTFVYSTTFAIEEKKK